MHATYYTENNLVKSADAHSDLGTKKSIPQIIRNLQCQLNVVCTRGKPQTR